MRAALCAVAASLAIGCGSIPGPRPLESVEREQLAAMQPSGRTAVIRGCEPGANLAAPQCELLVREMAKMLERTDLFAGVRRPPDTGPADAIVVVVRPFERRSYVTKPSHNPALFLLSPVVPLWWSEPFGYHFAATDPSSGRTVEVDTRRSGTVVVWGLAPLLNVSERRSPFDDRELEQDHVRLQLAPLLVR